MSIKKKLLLPTPQKRTREQINNEYTQHCAQVGHKMRLISQLEEEVPQHVDAMKALNAEIQKLPPDAPAPVPEPTADEPQVPVPNAAPEETL